MVPVYSECGYLLIRCLCASVTFVMHIDNLYLLYTLAGQKCLTPLNIHVQIAPFID